MSKIPGGMSFASWTKKPYSPATDGMHICLPVLERGADRHEMTRCNLFALRQFILASTRRRVCCTSLICRLRLVGKGRNICAKFTLRGKQRKMPLLFPHFTKRSSAQCRILFPNSSLGSNSWNRSEEHTSELQSHLNLV